jgi:hypothetical protein
LILTRKKGEPDVSHFFHAMVLYSEEADRDVTLAPTIDGAIKKNSMISFIISEERSKPLVVSARKRSHSLKSKALIVRNAAALHARGRTIEDSFSRLFEINQKKFDSGGYRSWTQVADWAYKFYPQVEEVLRVERSLARRGGNLSVYCCFRKEGFASLDPGVIAELMELHHQVIFPATTFNWTPRLGPAT